MKRWSTSRDGRAIGRSIGSWTLAALLCCGLVLRVTAQAAATQAMDLARLMAAFSRMPGLEASFVEEKHIGLLARPLESRGRLFFARPGLLLRRVERPQRSEVIITPKELKLRDADGEQTIDLGSRPDIRPFVQSLTWLLAGDQTALAAVYDLDFRVRGPARAAPGPDTAQVWQLTLTPKAAPLSQLIASIQVIGGGLAVREVRVREKGGDETVTRIVEADPARHFAPAELARLFGIEPKPKPGGP